MRCLMMRHFKNDKHLDVSYIERCSFACAFVCMSVCSRVPESNGRGFVRCVIFVTHHVHGCYIGSKM